jgi:hypothetical protein
MRLLYFNDSSTHVEVAQDGSKSYFGDGSNTRTQKTLDLTMSLDSSYKSTYKWVAAFVSIVATAPDSGNLGVTLYPGTGVTNVYYTT